jgi:tRNA pseudouridine55 synthase
MLLLVDKPKGITSHDVVNQVRRITGERRVGHGGTLDPNATGLLVIGVGRESTKLLGEVTKNMPKEYEAEIILGEERSTDDSEGEITKIGHAPKKIVEKDIEELLLTFVGEQEQMPPIFSAIKKMGQKAYELARKGKIVDLDPRFITVYEAELLHFKYPVIKVRFAVSSGTYIRALARDMGRKLGTYGYLNNLKRTKIGKYRLSQAVSLDRLENSNWREYSINASK